MERRHHAIADGPGVPYDPKGATNNTCVQIKASRSSTSSQLKLNLFTNQDNLLLSWYKKQSRLCTISKEWNSPTREDMRQALLITWPAGSRRMRQSMKEP